ncbi:FAD-dependent oxidoreductase, partial [Hafnia paralvei]|uniref:FAD-dependent oxidoreductase n=1 Tax=Hafnia paralvei TaxID=546367 RepID=UPI002162697C
MGATVNEIQDYLSENKIILKYTDSINNKERSEEFDYVVCAIPFSSLRRIEIKPSFTTSKMQAINEMNYAIAHKIYLYLRKRFWEMGSVSKKIIGGYSFTDLPVVSICYPSDHSKPIPGKYGKWTMETGSNNEEAGVLLAAYSWCQDA